MLGIMAFRHRWMQELSSACLFWPLFPLHWLYSQTGLMVARWLSGVPGLPPAILPTLAEREHPFSMALLNPRVDLFGSARVMYPEPLTGQATEFSDWLNSDHVPTSVGPGRSPLGVEKGDPQRERDREGERHVHGPCHTPHVTPSAASTGGNAGIAAAYSARRLGIPATIVLPEGAPLKVVRRLQGEGAEVQLTGKVRTLAREIVSFPFG